MNSVRYPNAESRLLLNRHTHHCSPQVKLSSAVKPLTYNCWSAVITVQII